ncbi:MAG: hypothetical protein H6730_21515 [Deltaproteobacteria bacterium]|nr:hypothetical protein [Deltaproteobacteria bacterium]
MTTYLEKVIRASAQLANASSEIARRYQLLNRADLARSVLGRAYTRAYQESFLISALMTGFAQAVSPAEQDQIIRQIELAQRTYRVAMLDMQDRYDRIDDSVNAFGFLPDYVPFPALDEDSLNGLVPMFERANRTLDAAAEQEQIALATRRDFDVDEAAFQNELATVTQNYKARLGEICGTFVGSDGRVYPAVAQFAHLDPELAERTDPCGATKTGALWLKGADIETRALELQRVRAEIGNVLESAKIAEQSVAAQCGLIAEDVQLFLEKESVVNGYKTTIASLQFTNRQLDKAKDLAAGISDGIQAVGEQKTLKDIFEKVADLIIYSIAAVVHFAATTSLEAVILAKQLEIQKLEQDYASAQIGRQCVYLSTELGFTLRQIHLEMNLLELDALNAIWNLQVDLQLLTQLDNERKRLNDEWQASEALVIDAAAAKSDPNVRIYKNDAVINADRSFERALRDAYRATRIFEYYTSQSYAGLDKLFLVRMVDAGDVNLRNYMAELEDALFEFQEQFGNPDSRIHVLSLKDDVFRVPLYSSDGRPLTTEERTELFRARLTDPLLLDDSGFIAVKFSTGFDLLSPLTHNHKILFMEVELFGSDVGDDVARVYVRQKGTGVVKTSNGGRLYYAFEPKTAVINPVVNGFRDYGQDSDGAITGPTRSIFRNYRFRERPFVNTNWELVINKRTEAANEDLNLAGLDDVNLYIYYTDFTNFEE